MPETSQMNLGKVPFLILWDIFYVLGMTTIKHIYHQIAALILLNLVNTNWFYHIF